MAELAALYAWDFEPGRLPEMRERLARRPEYPAAVRRLAANMVGDAEGDAALADLLRDAGRTVAGLSAAYLGLSGEVTLARLKTLMAGFGLTSPGRVRALLSHMQHLRYVEPTPQATPSRLATFRLTGRFLASYTDHERSLVEAAAVIEPDARRVLERLDQREVLATLVAQQAESFALTSRLPNPFVDWFGVFMHRHGGIQTLHALMAEAPAFPPVGLLPLRTQAIARRFKVSRVHVARMFADAQELGFVRLGDGGVAFTETGRAALEWIYAGRLCVHLRALARTVKTLPQLEAAPVA